MTDELIMLNRIFGGRVFVLETMPKGTILIVPAPRLNETIAELAKRCVRVENIGQLETELPKLLEKP